MASSNDPGPESIAEVLNSLLMAFRGADLIVRDLSRFPNSVTAEERSRLELGRKNLGATVNPVFQGLGRIALSPRAQRELHEAALGDPACGAEWHRFRVQVGRLRRIVARLSRTLRSRKPTGEAGDAALASGSEDGAVPGNLKALNRQLLALEVLAGVAEPESRPPRVLIDVANKCNFRCRTCYQSHNQEFVFYDLDRDTFDNMRPFLKFATCVNFAGTGEPLLSPDTPYFVGAAALHGASTELVTNGSLLDRLAGVEGASRIYVSLDGASSETVDTIRKGARFEQIISGIRDLTPSLRGRVVFNMVVCRPNVHEVHSLARLAKELGIAGLHLQAFHAYLPWHEEMKLRDEDRPFLAAQIRAAEDELAGTAVALRVMLPVDKTVASSNGEPPNHAEVLRHLDLVPVVHPDVSESWDAMSSLFLEESEIVLPSQLRALSAQNTDGIGVEKGPIPEPDESALRSRIAVLLDHVNAMPRLTLPHCIAPYTLLYMLGDGSTRPCCVLDARVSNLGEKPAREAWHSEGYVELRRKLSSGDDLPPACHGCEDGGRFVLLDQLLEDAAALGVDLTKVELPQGTVVPSTILERIQHLKVQQMQPH